MWSHATTAPIEVSASVGSDGTVVVSTNNHTVYALKADGALKWKSALGTESYSSSSVSGALAYYGDNSGALHVVQERNGAPVATDHGTKGLWLPRPSTAGATSTSGPKASTSTASDRTGPGSSTSSRRVRSTATRR